MKAILLSINPEHAYNIIKGRKTLELRKKVPKDFVGWVYVYVTKKKPDIMISDYTINYPLSKFYNDLNGTIPFRFWFDKYDTLEYINMWSGSDYIGNDGVVSWSVDGSYLDNLCLDYQNVLDYGFREKPKPYQKTLYAWHIKKLDIFDKPMQLSEFRSMKGIGLVRPMQSWGYVYVEKH